MRDTADYANFAERVIASANSGPGGPMLKELVSVGVEPWIVGGYVRDHFLGSAAPRDLDLMVSNEHWLESMGVLASAGAMVLPYNCHRIELTDWRVDSFSPGTFFEGFSTIEEALCRFDFSANAIGISLVSGKVLNPVRGLEDLESRLLRPLPGAWADAALSSDQALTLLSRLFRLTRSTNLSVPPESEHLIEQFQCWRPDLGPARLKPCITGSVF
jgi:tRNA nucleotidyltransferase/poly(A) polymerase